jgi:hypothetical protein
LNCSPLSEFLVFMRGCIELMKLLRQAVWFASCTESEYDKTSMDSLVSLFKENSLNRQAASYKTVGLYSGSVRHFL